MFSSWNKMHLIYGNESQHSFLCKTLDALALFLHQQLVSWLTKPSSCSTEDSEPPTWVPANLIQLYSTKSQPKQSISSFWHQSHCLLWLMPLVTSSTISHQRRKLEGKALPWASRLINIGILPFENSLDCLELPVFEALKLKVLHQNP